jgi:hypothetical protein
VHEVPEGSIEGTKALHNADLGTLAQTSAIIACRKIPRRLCGRRLRMQPADQRQDVGKHLSQHRNLGHLEDHVASVVMTFVAALSSLSRGLATLAGLATRRRVSQMPQNIAKASQPC